VEKDRRRWLVAYKGVEFFVNLDRLIKPATEGYYLEIKSRTWSRRDAQDKAAIINELLGLFGASPDNAVKEDYVELTGQK
jgi:adenylate cyclase class IV